MHPDKSKQAETRQHEQRLIRRIQARESGWRDLFGELVGAHIPAILGRCQVQLRNADDAADATQETLFRAYQAIERFRGASALRTWLFAIADNECRTLARKRARYQLDPELESRLAQMPAGDPAGAQADAQMLHRAMRHIGPGSRDVLQLRYFADLQIHEVATQLGIGLSAAKMRLYRAQEQLADAVRPLAMEQAA